MEIYLIVLILELNDEICEEYYILVSAQDQYAVYPRRIRHIEHLEGHLDTLKTYTAYDPIIYAVS